MKQVHRAQIVVEAPTREAAEAQAKLPERHEVEFSADVRQHLGEEGWVSCPRWYDLHGPGDVIVAHRSLGNVFTEREVELLRARIETAVGVRVVDSWNGAGVATVSFRAEGRVGTIEGFTPEQRAAIEAPRPWVQP